MTKAAIASATSLVIKFKCIKLLINNGDIECKSIFRYCTDKPLTAKIDLVPFWSTSEEPFLQEMFKEINSFIYSLIFL